MVVNLRKKKKPKLLTALSNALIPARPCWY